MDGNLLARACVGGELGIERKTLARFEFDRPVGERLDTDLRPLQVRQHGHGQAQLAGRRAHPGDTLAMILGASVRKVDPDDIHPGRQQTRKHVRGIRRRAQRSDNLGFAIHASRR